MRRTEEERAVLYAPQGDKALNSGKLYRSEFDVELFFLYMEQGVENLDSMDVFYEKMRKEYQEWL